MDHVWLMRVVNKLNRNRILEVQIPVLVSTGALSKSAKTLFVCNYPYVICVYCVASAEMCTAQHLVFLKDSGHKYLILDVCIG